MEAYLTGDTVADNDYICRLLRIPNDPLTIAIINGFLGDMCNPESFEAHGDLSPDEMATRFIQIYQDYRDLNVCSVGKIESWACDPAMLPDNRLACDGSVVSRVDYPRLYEVLPVSLRVDADNVKLPDLRERFIVGVSTNPEYDLLATGGQSHVPLTVEQLPEHTHTAQPHAHTTQPHGHWYDKPFPNLDVEAPGVPDPLALGTPFIPTLTNLVNVDVDAATVTIDMTGNGGTHENRPPFYALIMAIVAW